MLVLSYVLINVYLFLQSHQPGSEAEMWTKPEYIRDTYTGTGKLQVCLRRDLAPAGGAVAGK